jgi:nitrite reductase/ring-hydroxylating ferredoxin subunit
MIHDDGPDNTGDAGNAAAGPDCARRSLLRGAVVLGAVGVGGALSRIGAGSSDAVALTAAQGTTATTGAAKSPATPTDTAPVKTPAKKPGTAAKGKAVGLASQVPVGGGMIFPKAQVVVTQPTAGEFKAFDANCTHQACLVVEVADGTINCACHGAKFSITDGSNTTFFPITDPLRAKSVTVSGGKIIVA